MNLRVAGSLCAVSLLAAGCFVPEDARPQVGLSTELATKFVHRGMTQVDRPVLQPRLSVGLPTGDGDRIGFVAKGNIDLRNDNGNSWFPDGQAGRFTEVDFVADYQKSFGDVTVNGGIFSYNLPNGLEFQNGERGATTEVFVRVSANVLEATPYLSWHYDFDEVRAPYYRGGLTENFDLGQNFTIVLDGSLGYATSAQSSWMYGIDASGFADLRGKASLLYQYDARTQLSASVNGSMILDDTIDDWFDQLNIDSNPIWFTIGVGWAF